MMNNYSSRSTTICLVFPRDICGLVLVFNLAFMLRFEDSPDWHSLLSYGVILLSLLGLYLTDTYRLTEKISGIWLSQRVLFGIIYCNSDWYPGINLLIYPKSD